MLSKNLIIRICRAQTRFTHISGILKVSTRLITALKIFYNQRDEWHETI